MASKNRTVKMWASLVASMTVGAVVLMAMDHQKISGGGFSLASFQRLDTVDHALKSDANTEKLNWGSIEITYSHTVGGTIENIALAQGTLTPAEADFHFLIGNGDGAPDGEIVPSHRWNQQIRCADNSKTIKIIIVSDGMRVRPTDTQIKRLSKLISTLSRYYSISSKDITCPKSLDF
jgi:hypothetical protein